MRLAKPVPTSHSKAPTRTGCPSSEELAAFIDGRREGPARERIVEHLASCEDCYAVFAGVVDFQNEEGAGATSEGEEEETQASADSEAPSAVVVPFPERERRRIPRYRSLPLAACLLAGVGGALLLYRYLYTPPSLDSGKLLASVEGQAGSPDTWYDEERGDAEPPSELTAASFMVGVYWTDLRIAVLANDLTHAQNIALQALTVLGLAGDQSAIEASLFADLDSTTVEFLRRLSRGTVAPAQIQAGLDDNEQRLDRYFETQHFPEFGFGKWAAVGRFAALAHDSTFFRRSAAGHRYLRWLRRQRDLHLEPEDLEGFQAGFRAAASGAADYEDLVQRFAAIIHRYEEGLE